MLRAIVRCITLLRMQKMKLNFAIICHLVGPIILNVFFSIALTLAVPVDQIEAASRELRSYLVSKNSIALSVLDHLDSNYIFGKSVFEN